MFGRGQYFGMGERAACKAGLGAGRVRGGTQPSLCFVKFSRMAGVWRAHGMRMASVGTRARCGVRDVTHHFARWVGCSKWCVHARTLRLIFQEWPRSNARKVLDITCRLSTVGIGSLIAAGLELPAAAMSAVRTGADLAQPLIKVIVESEKQKNKSQK